MVGYFDEKGINQKNALQLIYYWVLAKSLLTYFSN